MTPALSFLARWIVEPDDDTAPRTGERTWMEAARPVVRTTILLASFLVLQRIILKFFRLPDDGPSHESILLEGLRLHAPVLIPALLAFGAVSLAVPRMRRGWDQFEGGTRLRWFIGIVAVTLAWVGSAYAYNAWYGQAHLPDRLMLIALAGLVVWRPLFVLPFACAFWTIVWQFNAPALGFTALVADFRPLVHTLTLFSVAFLANVVFGGRRMTDFLFLALCLVAADFWVPALAKLKLGWVTHGHLNFMLPDAYAHGWLAFVGADTITRVAGLLASLDWPMRIGTLAIECGALFMFASARTARTLLLLCTLLLGMFFLMLGYLFWKWMVLQAALWVLLFEPRNAADALWRTRLFSRIRFAMSLVVIGAAVIWFTPAALAWFDTPITNAVRFEAVGASGAVYDLPPGFFAPYESHIAMAGFVGRITPAPVLTTSYGATSNRSIADALLEARTPQDVLHLEAGIRGHFAVADEAGRQFDEFVRRTAQASNRRLDAPSSLQRLAVLRPPPFIWTFPRGRRYPGEEPIDRVHVYRVSSFFDGERYTVFRRQLLRTVTIREESANRRP